MCKQTLAFTLQLRGSLVATGVAAAQPHRQLRVCQVESTSQLSELLSLSLGCDARPHIILTTMQKLATLQHKRGQVQRIRSGAGGRQRASTSAASRQGSVAAEHEGALPSSQAGIDETMSLAAANGVNGVSAGGDGGMRAALLASPEACRGPVSDEVAAAWAAAGRIAIIADEAHRHHGAGTTDLINEVLAAAAAAAAAVAAPGAAAAGPCVSRGRTGEDTGGAALRCAQNDSNLGGTAAPRGGCEADLALGQQDKLKGKGRGKGKAGVQGKGAAPIAQQPNNVTYIGFTATPGHRALQLFGVVSQVTCDVLGDVVSSSDDEPDEDGDGDRAALGQGGGAQAAERQPAEDEGDADAPLKARTERVTVFSPFHSYTMQQVRTLLQRLVCAESASTRLASDAPLWTSSSCAASWRWSASCPFHLLHSASTVGCYWIVLYRAAAVHLFLPLALLLRCTRFSKHPLLHSNAGHQRRPHP